MKGKWIWLLFLIGCIVLVGMVGEGLARKDFPTKSLQIYVGWGGGGSTCMQTRVLAQKLSEILEVAVVVIPKPGAGGTIANDHVRRAKPDGYKLCVATTSNTVGNLLLRKVPYTIEDFDFLCQFSNQATILAVNRESPWKTLDELIAYAKEHPGELKYPSAGIGTSAHIIMEMFGRAAGIEIVHVPMKSGAEMLSTVLGGHCQLVSQYVVTIAPALTAQRFRPLALNHPRRLKKYPDIPTFAELGLPQVEYNTYYGIAGPKGLRKEALDILKDSLGQAAQDKDVQATLRKLGLLPEYKTAEEFSQFVHRESKRIRKIFVDIGIPIVE